MYHILKRRSMGSYQTPSLNTIAIGPPSFSQSSSGLRTGDAALYFAAWNGGVGVVWATRKSSTNSGFPTSRGMTAGGLSRYGRGIGSRVYFRFGGHSTGRRIPL